MKAISLIKYSKMPAMSVNGAFAKLPPPRSLAKDMPNETQREIFKSAFYDLRHRNLHFIAVMPQLWAYSKELAMYHVLTEYVNALNAKDPRLAVVVERRGEDVIDPLSVQANRCLQNVMKLSKLLALDPYSRARTPSGPPPIEEIKKDGSAEFLNL